MNKTVLVTGGNGYIANWCIRLLEERGFHVRATSRTARPGFVCADLTRDEGWEEAVTGCHYVLHVASPLSGQGDLTAPARDGTLRVLQAASRAGVERVVMTSAAAAARIPGQPSDETVWAEPDQYREDPYRLSKTLAERAAWQAIDPKQLTTILPGAVFGPALSARPQGSLRVLKQLRWFVPWLGFWVVDVRDLAELHIQALLEPRAAGQRFLATGEFLWMKEIAQILGHRPWLLPNWLARRLPPLRPFRQDLGKQHPTSSAKAREWLGFQPRPARQTILESL
ncbi:MAG: NAD-dependent epimerase/dehydratase family protein [Candidatus Eremiobacteraeota bacterium]|nr:NAD-dependent epimerase/dehydratase family protein [Candidatus Eremiobacteraeota bacterium]MCW5868600.1 NAD-dependent epimerase/dehydratase family protein [Candidatus Eremiobacteraeota bacterium]